MYIYNNRDYFIQINRKKDTFARKRFSKRALLSIEFKIAAVS